MIPYKSILVTGANGDLGFSIGRILLEVVPDARLHGSDTCEMWPGKSIFPNMHVLPRADDPAYLEKLNDLATATNADLIVPASVVELEYLARNWASVNGLPLLMNGPEHILPFIDKLDTANWLRDHDLPCPYTVPLADADPSRLPLIVKPRKGSGSKNIEFINSVEQLQLTQKLRQDAAVAQKHLGPDDQEYTCALFQIAGEKRTLIMRRKLLGGITSEFDVVDNNEIEHLLSAIAKASHLDGSLNVQLRLTKNGPRVFEINPRFSSTVMMRHQAGFRDLEWTLFARSGIAVPEFQSVPGVRVFRLDSELVVYT